MKRTRSLIALGKKVSFLTFVMLSLLALVSAQQESPATAEAVDGSKGAKFEVIEEDAPATDSSNLITASTYVFSSMGGVALEDMSSGTTQLVGPAVDDTASAVVDLGFDFWFDGVRASQFSCNANGLCRLGPVIVTTTFTNSLATTTAAPKIAPFWDDLCTATNGKVHYKTTGSPGTRKLIVEWLNMKITRNGTCVAPVANGSFQMWLFESTGVIQFVYPALGPTTADAGYSIGLQAGVATNFASVTTLDNSVSYAAANNAQMTAIPAGTSYLFTPNIPTAPSGLNFTAVSAVGMTLNWTDNSANEVGFAIYRSTDGVNYSFLTQTAVDATAFADTSLSPSTNYSYRVFAVSEGGLSTALSGSQMTPALGNISSAAGGGNWSSTATWVGGVVPGPGDQVTIVNGAVVTIDTAAAAYNVNVGTGGALSESDLGITNGVLQFEDATARTLTVGNDVVITNTGTFRSNTSGTVTTHSLSVAGDLTNNGILDFSTNADTAGAGITFTSGNDAVFGGTGTTTDIRTITVNKGTSRTPVLELTTSNFTVQGVTADNAGSGYLTLTNGTFKLSGAFTANLRTFTAAAFTIPATAGFWLNNPNYTVTGQNGSSTMSGLFRMSQGTFNIGVASGNSMAFTANSAITVEGGAINAAGRFGVTAAATAITYNQSGGTITVQTVGQVSTTLAGFDMGTSTLSFVGITGGTIVVQNANTAATTPRDYRLQSGSAATSNGTASVTGGTLQLGNSLTAAVQLFNIQGVVPNLVLTNMGGNHTATWGAPVTWNNITRNVTINSGTTFNIGNAVFLFNGVNFINDGTVTATGASSNFVPFDAAGNQIISGGGVWTGVTTNFGMQALTLTVNQTNQIRVRNLRVFTGSIINANKFTLGNNDATVSVIQFGNTTTPTLAGTLDSAPTFDLGTGGQTVTYLRTGNERTTGPEINPARTLVGLTYDNNDPATDTLTIAGGNLTVTATMALTNGEILTGANTITHNGAATRTAGFVNGTLNRSYTATGTYTYHVGVNGYSPVLANVTALTTNPSSLSVKPTDDFLPGLAQATAVSRYWTLTETGDLTADLTFTYTTPDVNGTEANYKVWRRNFDSTTEVTPSVINETNNTAMVTGITAFSDWGIGEALAPVMPFASIDGTVTSSSGIAIPQTVVVLSNAGGTVQTTLTNGFGNFEFDNIPTSVSYTITVSRKAYTFTPPSQMIFLTDNATGVNFSGTLSRPGPGDGKQP
jgi:hypothetical protein